MNARLIKETRALLPVLAGTLPLIVVPSLLWADAGFGYFALGVACVVMAGSAFGTEFQHRTLSLLLSQPIPRSVIWRDKMLVLGAGMAAGLVALLACLMVSGPVNGRVEWLPLALIPLCAFCGAPFWTLMLRHGIGGMVAAVGAPCGILAVYGSLALQFGHEPPALVSALLILLVSYCAVVYWLGYARFKRLEAVDSPARDLSLPAGLEAFFMRPLTKVSSRFRGPFGTLLKKEFRLQQVSFLLAGVSVLIAAAACCLHQRHAEVARTIVWSDMLIYVFMLPLVAGAVSVGEERGWGMAEWHLTLPPSARMQWGAKLLATLSTSLLLGLLLPTILAVGAEALAGSLRPAIAAQSASVALGVVFAQVALTSVAVYAASFSRDTLRAILATFVLLAAGVGLVWSAAATAHQVIHRELYWLGYPLAIAELVRSLIPCALGFMLCLVHWFGWSNFRRLGATQPRLTAQLTVIFLGVWLITWLYFAMLIILTQS